MKIGITQTFPQWVKIIYNPPFGIDWKREQKAVEAEAARGEMGVLRPVCPRSAMVSSFLC